MAAIREHANCVEIPVGAHISRETSFAWSKPLDDPGYSELQSSPFVNLNIAYRYPNGFQFLGMMGLATTGIMLLLWVLSELSLVKLIPSALIARLLLVMIGCGVFYVCSNACFYFRCRVSQPLPLARNEFRALVGRESCTCFTAAFYLLGLFLQFARGGATGAIMYMLISLTAIAVLVPARLVLQRMTHEPINPGLLLSMFWSGALFSTNVAGILNTLLMLKWNHDDPYCSMMLPVGTQWPWQPAPLDCVGRAWLQWILTPGVIEESMKAACLLRLCTTIEKAARSHCLRACPRSSENSNFVCCAWFYKLAPSPVSFVLCGMAVGAGFATMENVDYIARMPDVASASLRLFSAMLHICMTGICSFTIAYGLFLGRRWKWPILLSGWLTMIVFHGSYDAACTFSQDLPDSVCVTGVTCGKKGLCFFCLLDTSTGEVAPMTTLLQPMNVSEAYVNSTAQQAHGEAGLIDFIQRQLLPPRQRPWVPLPVTAAAAATAPVHTNPCPRQASAYHCGNNAFVSWFPQTWPPFFLGGVIIVVFGVVVCFGLPVIERQFRMEVQS